MQIYREICLSDAHQQMSADEYNAYNEYNLDVYMSLLLKTLIPLQSFHQLNAQIELFEPIIASKPSTIYIL